MMANWHGWIAGLKTSLGSVGAGSDGGLRPVVRATQGTPLIDASVRANYSQSV